MLVTDRATLTRYRAENRNWQGIPSIEVTANGRLFAAFYSGGVTEQKGNYVVLLESRDDGRTWSEPIVAVDVGPDARAYDQCLWIDPLGRLWLFWAVQPGACIQYAICDRPDDGILRFSDIRTLDAMVMLNKPIVTRDGAWLFPCAIWAERVAVDGMRAKPGSEPGAYVFASFDHGKTFSRLGSVQAKSRIFDEHMLLETPDGIDMFIRTRYGIAKSHSSDGGCHFSPDTDSRFGGPGSRVFIGRLSSGRVLLVNHYMFAGRNNLTAILLGNDGLSYEGMLLLDERADVSYPDAKEHNGFLYIVYDRERGARYDPKADYTHSAREILMAKITEEDILAGHPINPDSRLMQIVSALGERGQNDD